MRRRSSIASGYGSVGGRIAALSLAIALVMTERAYALTLRHQQADQTAGAKQNHSQEKQPQQDRPAGLPDLREQKAEQIDDPHAHYRTHQGAHAAEQHIQNDLRRQHRTELARPDIALVKRVQA